MNVGRPTKYAEDVLFWARAYLDQGYEVAGDMVPSVAGLARALGVTKSTLYAWRDAHPDFSVVLEEVQAEQEKMLVSRGLSGAFNPTIAKLVLSKHGYSERLAADFRSGDGSMSPGATCVVILPAKGGGEGDDGA